MTRADQPGPGTQPPSETSCPEGVQSLWTNWISVGGLLLLAVTLILLTTFALFSAVTPHSNPYVDIIGYLILPGLFGAGLLVVPLGILLKRRKLRRTSPTNRGTLRLPAIDLNDVRQRRMILAFVGATLFVVLPVVGVSSYHGYHYTDSTEFCANVCHAVMEPQGTAHALSPHSRVTCAECHIGSGAGWFVKSKLSGTRQVFKTMQETYPRPIPPAITELRPARDTCEQCHWPAKFFGNQLREVIHYSPDEQNTRHVVQIMLKTGGGDLVTGRPEGIHMHMALSYDIQYVATDENLQEIPWVKMVDKNGREQIYRSDGRPTTEPPPSGFSRRIDCMDCHNRAAHNFRSPQEALNLAMNIGQIDATLPFVKREAVGLLDFEYESVEEASAAIERELLGFYQDTYPQVWREKEDRVRQTVAAVQEIQRRVVFPHMRVNWKTYPDNIGHMTSAGCFRCHDGRHVNQEGQAISSDCRVCHTFFNPIEGSRGITEGEFVHSMNLSVHGNLRCEQCHTGGVLPLCRDCHQSGEWLESRNRGRFVPYGPTRSQLPLPVAKP